MQNNKQNIPIFLSADNNYAPFVATTIASICDNTKSFCDFYVLDGGITDENKEKICELKKTFSNFSIEFIKIDIEKYFKDFQETHYITKSMYSRFLIPELKPNIDKAIYSDVDVIVLGDISKMYNEDLGEYALGAVWEEYAEKSENINRKINLNLPNEHKYFSSGNLLINCNLWRQNNIIKNLIQMTKNINIKLDCPDQDIMNVFFANKYRILDLKYCYRNQDIEYFKDEISNIIIRHFNGKIKPWHINPQYTHLYYPNAEKFWEYLKMTKFYENIYSKVQNSKDQQHLQRLIKIEKLVIKNIKDKSIGKNND